MRKRKHDNNAKTASKRTAIASEPSRTTETLAGNADPEHSYLGRADYLDTHAPIDEDHVSRYHRSPHQSANSATPGEILTFESLATRSARQSLVSSFLQKCRPWMPLVGAQRVHAMFETNEVPTFLMLAILVAGSKVSTAPRASELGQRCYDAAKLRFYTGCETDTLDVITGTIFLQWWNQTGPEHVSVDNSSLWLRLGVALAHQVGLHRQSALQKQQWALRRKLWWTLVVRYACLSAPSTVLTDRAHSLETTKLLQVMEGLEHFTRRIRMCGSLHCRTSMTMIRMRRSSSLSCVLPRYLATSRKRLCVETCLIDAERRWKTAYSGGCRICLVISISTID